MLILTKQYRNYNNKQQTMANNGNKQWQTRLTYLHLETWRSA